MRRLAASIGCIVLLVLLVGAAVASGSGPPPRCDQDVGCSGAPFMEVMWVDPGNPNLEFYWSNAVLGDLYVSASTFSTLATLPVEGCWVAEYPAGYRYTYCKLAADLGVSYPHDYDNDRIVNSGDQSANWPPFGPSIPELPYSSYATSLLDGLATAVVAVFPYAAALTVFAVGVGLVRRWLGARKATGV